MTPKIRSAQLFSLDIPFQLPVRHASHTRNSCNSVVLRIETSEGVFGYGEAVPRPYVTGESVSGVVDTIEQHIREQLIGQSLPRWQDSAEAIFEQTQAMLPDASQDPNVIAAHSARACLELALLDCVTKTNTKSLSALLPAGRSSVTYSGMLPTVSNDRALELVGRMTAYGMTRLKLKVGDEGDVGRVSLLREKLGPDFELYVDANCAWTLEEAIERIEQLSRYDISLVEQPIPRGDVRDLAKLREATSVPIMVDESLVTLADARVLIDAQACDIFNIRISKCGGLSNCLSLAQMAEEAGLSYQIGAHVGETAILSAAGRHLGLALRGARYVEGSYGGFLLSEDLCSPPFQFEPGALGYPLPGPGLGVDIKEERLNRLAIEQRHIGATS